MNGQGSSSTSEASPGAWSLSGSARSSVGIAQRPASVTGGARQAFDRSFELPNGYTFQLVNRADQLAALMELLVREGISHRFSRVAITIDHQEGSFWVRISGPPEVKAFLRERVLCDSSCDSEGGSS